MNIHIYTSSNGQQPGCWLQAQTSYLELLIDHAQLSTQPGLQSPEVLL